MVVFYHIHMTLTLIDMLALKAHAHKAANRAAKMRVGAEHDHANNRAEPFAGPSAS